MSRPSHSNTNSHTTNSNSHSSNSSKRHISLTTHLISGGLAGLVESSACHPLDTIKVRMQLQGRSKMPNGISIQRIGPMSMASQLFKQEGLFAFYKGFGAVVSAIVPKMAIRFSSFEFYKRVLVSAPAGTSIKPTTMQTFIAGLGAGITESILVVNPIEVIKIRLQAQRKVLGDAAGPPLKYRNAFHAATTIIKEEGLIALYKGVSLTAARQATNQAVNFTLYQKGKTRLAAWQGLPESALPSWQHFLVGGLSGAIAPMANAPIDTLKTRIQRQVSRDAHHATASSSSSGGGGWRAIHALFWHILQHEGWRAFYNGLTPRLLRIAPGQAITFAVYEKVAPWVDRASLKVSGGALSVVERTSESK